uniref:Uncharacterized protein n=1 Tax=Pseudothermotoga hypogea TaxID=57487 RepID=A0A832MPM2_9THEM
MGLNPETMFYDWIYMNVLHQNKILSEKVTEFSAFTDIEFNPKRSVNCHVRSAALYVSLYRRGLIEKALRSPDNYKMVIRNIKNENHIDTPKGQMRLNSS